MGSSITLFHPVVVMQDSSGGGGQTEVEPLQMVWKGRVSFGTPSLNHRHHHLIEPFIIKKVIDV